MHTLVDTKSKVGMMTHSSSSAMVLQKLLQPKISSKKMFQQLCYCHHQSNCMNTKTVHSIMQARKDGL